MSCAEDVVLKLVAQQNASSGSYPRSIRKARGKERRMYGMETGTTSMAVELKSLCMSVVTAVGIAIAVMGVSPIILFG